MWEKELKEYFFVSFLLLINRKEIVRLILVMKVFNLVINLFILN